MIFEKIFILGFNYSIPWYRNPDLIVSYEKQMKKKYRHRYIFLLKCIRVEINIYVLFN